MIGGCINTRQSRRTRFNRCLYWKRDKSVKDLAEYKHLKAYDGIFYAKEENSHISRNNVVGGAFMFNENYITISTSDDVNIDSEDIVEFESKLWRVSSVQVKEIHKQSQFLKQVDRITYLELKR